MKKKVKWIVLCCVITLGLTGAFLLWRNSHYLYILGEYLGVHCQAVPVVPAQPEDLEPRSLAELQADSRVRFDQSALLINGSHPLPEGFSPELSYYKDTDVEMNVCLQEAYGQLSQAVQEETGSPLYVSSAFRTREEQEVLYREDPATANLPDTSEHQVGLGIDVYTPYYAGFGFLKSQAGQFVNSRCWEYGFLIRYPCFGQGETGMKYEPWHIRYVGQPHAKILYHNHLTLEAYMESLTQGVWYQAEGYFLCRQALGEGDTLSLPQDFSGAVISEDNLGGYLITLQVG